MCVCLSTYVCMFELLTCINFGSYVSETKLCFESLDEDFRKKLWIFGGT